MLVLNAHNWTNPDYKKELEQTHLVFQDVQMNDLFFKHGHN